MCEWVCPQCFSIFFYSTVFPLLSSTWMRMDEIMPAGIQEAEEDPSHPASLPHLDALECRHLSSGPLPIIARGGLLPWLRPTQSEGWPLSEQYRWDVFCRTLLSALSSQTSASGRTPGHISFRLPVVMPPYVCGSRRLPSPTECAVHATLFSAGLCCLSLLLCVEVLEAYILAVSFLSSPRYKPASQGEGKWKKWAHCPSPCGLYCKDRLKALWSTPFSHHHSGSRIGPVLNIRELRPQKVKVTL